MDSNDLNSSNNIEMFYPKTDSDGNSQTEKPFNDNFENSISVKFAVNISWFVNWFLLVAKIYCTIVSSSKAVTASLADSAVDLMSQGVLAISYSYSVKYSSNYPVGRSRLEALSVIACSFIMSMASVESKFYLSS